MKKIIIAAILFTFSNIFSPAYANIDLNPYKPPQTEWTARYAGLTQIDNQDVVAVLYECTSAKDNINKYKISLILKSQPNIQVSYKLLPENGNESSLITDASADKHFKLSQSADNQILVKSDFGDFSLSPLFSNM